MGVQATINGLTFTTAGKNKAVAVGCDLEALRKRVSMRIDEINADLNFLVNNILTPAGGESSNISSVNTQITALT